MYQTLNDLEMNIQENQEKQENSRKGKKRLKWSLTFLGIFIVLIGIRGGLTKAGIIPNRLGIELLCPGKGEYTKEPDGNGECPNGYELIYGKCHEEGWPHRGGSESAGTIGCLNCEYYDAADECSKYYKMPKVEGYTKENYEVWVNLHYPENENPDKNQKEGYGFRGDIYFSRSEDLSRKPYYDEWLDDEFDGYQEALKEYERHQNSCRSYTQVDKPIIYLYPTIETEINVKLGTPENLSHTYPKYNSEKGWNVIAQPDGDLEDMDTGRKLYALYREGKSDNETNFDEGFVVKGEDIIPFLEEKLAILGLNEREAEEFIVYRLPQMENNEYNLIRFETKAEQDENMPLNITPTPDTVIRVMMDWKAIDEPAVIPEQQLVTPERIGFTVVEWGGSPRN